MTCRKREAIATARRIGGGLGRRWQSLGKACSRFLCAISERAPDGRSLGRGGGLDWALISLRQPGRARAAPEKERSPYYLRGVGSVVAVVHLCAHDTLFPRLPCAIAPLLRCTSDRLDCRRKLASHPPSPPTSPTTSSGRVQRSSGTRAAYHCTHSLWVQQQQHHTYVGSLATLLAPAQQSVRGSRCCMYRPSTSIRQPRLCCSAGGRAGA
jgi:hypothetical protein